MSQTGKPHRFTIFMCHLTKATIKEAPNEAKSRIKAMFGKAKVNNNTAAFHTKSRYYIVDSYCDFMDQLDVCMKSLEFFTCKRGIASSRYRTLRSLMKDKEVIFRSEFKADTFFGFRLGCFADGVFQDFIAKLSNKITHKDTL